MMKLKIGFFIDVAALILAFALHGCSSGSEKIIHKTYTVEIRQMQFMPSALYVQKGDTVVFTNNDILVHDVTEEANKSWTSSPLSPGQSYKLVVTQNSDYYCSIHPVMKGMIILK